MAKAKRIKRNYKFQLNIAKPVEAWLDEWIPKLKTQKLFSQYVRDGLSLMIHFAEWGIAAQSVYDLFKELREGRTDKLFEMFPHLQERVGQGAITQTPQPAPLDRSALAKEIAEELLLRGGKGGQKMVEQLSQQIPIGQGKPLIDAPKAEAKKAKAVDASTIADNFLSCF